MRRALCGVGMTLCCMITAPKASDDPLDLTYIPDWEEQQAALQSLRARLCEAWLRREPTDVFIALAGSVDASAYYEFQIVRPLRGRMTIRVTTRQTFVVPEPNDDPSGRLELAERVYDTASTEEFDEVGIVAAWPLRDPQPSTSVCSALLDSPRSRLRLRDSTSGRWRDW